MQLHTDIGAHSDSILATLPPQKSAPTKSRKKLIRGADRDYSQSLRRAYQAAFLLLNVWLGAQFYF